jgi:hypothetical protein
MPIPNNSLMVVRDDTAGGNPTFPSRLVRLEFFQIEKSQRR